MSIISTISILLTADSASLRTELRRTRAQLSTWGREARQGIQSVSTAFAGTAVVAGAAISVMVAKSLESARATDQMAAKLGIASESLAGFQYAAAQFNVEGEQAADVLEQLNIRITEYAEIGTGEAADFFEVTKLNVQDFAKLRPDEQILKVASALESMPRNTQVMFLDQLTGGEGVKMIDMLGNGAEGLKVMTAEAKSLGVALSDIEIAQLAEADRALSRVGAAFSGVGNQMAIGLSPYIQALTDQFVNFAKDSGGFKEPIINGIKSVAHSVAFLGDAWHGLTVVAKTVEVAVSGVMTGIIISLDEVNKFFLKSMRTMVDGITTVLAAPLDLLAPLSDSAKEIAENLKSIGNNDFFAPSKSLSNMAEVAREETGKLAGELHDLAMQETMGQSVERFIADVEAQAIGSAKVIAEQRASARASANDASASAPVGLVDQQNQEQLQAEIQAIREAAMTELELLDLKHELELEKVWGHIESRALLEEEGMAILESLESQHQERRTAIEKKGLSDREKFERLTTKGKTKMVMGEMSSLLSGVAQQNKTMFKLNQAAGISNAIINTYEGASESLSKYPMPIGGIMAAAHVAAGMAQVNSIRSASFGNGSISSASAGSVSAPQSVSGFTPSALSAPEPVEKVEQKPQTTVQFIGDWSGVSRESIDQVMDGITEKLENGGVLFGPGSEQAQALTV